MRFKELGFLLIRTSTCPECVLRAKSKVSVSISRSHVRERRTLARPVPIPDSVSMIDLGISFVRHSFRRGKGTKRLAAEPAGTGSPSRFKTYSFFSFFLSLFLSLDRSFILESHPRYARWSMDAYDSPHELPKVLNQKSRTWKIVLWRYLSDEIQSWVALIWISKDENTRENCKTYRGNELIIQKKLFCWCI